jgi:hypothetical protein
LRLARFNVPDLEGEREREEKRGGKSTNNVINNRKVLKGEAIYVTWLSRIFIIQKSKILDRVHKSEDSVRYPHFRRGRSFVLPARYKNVSSNLVEISSGAARNMTRVARIPGLLEAREFQNVGQQISTAGERPLNRP